MAGEVCFRHPMREEPATYLWQTYVPYYMFMMYKYPVFCFVQNGLSLITGRGQ